MSIDDDNPHAQVMDAIAHGRPIEAQYVRQAKRGMRIVWVLAISLALAALVTFGMWLLHAPRLAATNLHPPPPHERQTFNYRQR
jgi:hypothetical protein